MRRLERCLRHLEKEGRKALVPFITGGFPTLKECQQVLHTFSENGADIIEVGIPFSDPMADGPTIQLANDRVLRDGTTTDHIFELVYRFRQSDQVTPIILMSYLNPIEAYGYEKFSREAGLAGADGVIIVDLPPESAGEIDDCFKAQGMEMIYLIAPTSSDHRIQLISAASGSYLYYVSVNGVTGASQLNVEATTARVRHIREISDLPVMVGFGISNAETARSIGSNSNGIVVGSAFIKMMLDSEIGSETRLKNVKELTRSLRAALNESTTETELV